VGPTLRELLQEPGLGTVPDTLRPYTTPLTKSIAAPPGSKLLPSRSGGILHEEAVFGGTGLTVTSAYGYGDANPSTFGVDGVSQSAVDRGPGGYGLSSSPLGIPTAARPVQGVAYAQLSALWNLGGIATGWSRPLGANPGRKPTTKLAIGNWTPFAGGVRPLPSNPAPGQMITPGF
jgi:hypothetical protein